ncbi:Predicted exporter [Thalassospira xiamenensis M-5 = DSM 17429]|uniref:RND superfamily drug exporter n=1 Tax=Thalassospira xiamenensis M-5 = DSM 17429 TaxID=1123366 RepID=A0AB72UFL2_9PROT|nr:MMPL family transporter [Thalassospira xiamenensis]AJD52903.1 putative RND superfamily drug exporter [Thalassospira xiamenensis M-5 = DSM 17429]SIT19145.1 Predicted exporter [Thalassospira xiamenensis M-5 = DSM 17429]
MALRATLWALCLITMAVFATWQLRGGHTGIDADILSLIGQENAAPNGPQTDIATVRHLLANDGQQAIFMLSHSDRDTLETAATDFAGRIAALDGTQTITLPRHNDNRFADLMALYGPHANSLLSPSDREKLANGDAETLYRRAIQNLYSPATTLSSQSLKQDPFALLPAFLSDLGAKLGTGNDVIARDGQFYLPVMASLSPDLRSSGNDQKWVADANTALQSVTDATPGLSVAKTGQIFFAVAEATRAQSDVQRIAIIATIGILVMIGLVFYSPIPLFGALLVVGSGLLAGLAAVVAIFPAIHAIALVFGATMIGISVDYALHYLVLCSAAGSPTDRLHKIRPGLSLGLLTSVIGFGALSLSPTQLLSQIAVYSIAGLIAAYCSVLFLLPLIPARDVRPSSPIRKLHDGLQAILGKTFAPIRVRLIASAAIIITLALAAFLIPGNNDIRQFGHGNDALISDAGKIADILGLGGSPVFIRIDGDDPQNRLETGKAVRHALTPLIADNRLGGMIGLSDLIPSITRQTENRGLVTTGLYDRFGAALSNQLPVNITAPDMDAGYLVPDEDAAKTLPEITLLHSGGSDIIRLRNATDIDAIRLALADIQNVTLINPPTAISDQFAAYRLWAWIALGSALGVAAILAVLRYGFRTGIFVFAAPAGAILFAVLGGYVFGIDQSFFTTMALFLVFAIGADYVLFLAESRNSPHDDDTRLAVLLSLISSVLAFGLLATSSVPLVRDIGSVIAIGLIGAWFLAFWMTAPTETNHNTQTQNQRGQE